MIQIKNLSKGFGGNQVLSGINIDMQPEKTYGVVGANGAGKTTLFRCIAKMEKFEGSIGDSTIRDFHTSIGYLPTQPPVLSKITGKEYIKLLLAARQIRIKELPNIFGLPFNQYVESYSTGMLKKLALQGVVLQDNSILLLDEPFNGLDYESNLMVMEILKRLTQKGKTLLISSHIFSVLSDCCDEIFVLEEGKISKTVGKEDFVKLESEMKSKLVGRKIDGIIPE